MNTAPASPALPRLAPPPEPAGYEAFWRKRYGEALAVDLRPELRPLTTRSDGTRVFEIWFNTWGGLRLGGWLTRPAGEARCGFVVGHGYGGRDGPDCNLPRPDATAIFPCLRGLSLSCQPGLPDVSQEHVLHGIEHRDTYIHGGCVADLWCAASVLLALEPAVAGRLFYSGVSFGGGMGAMALAWDRRFHAGHLGLPSHGPHPYRLRTPCNGAGEPLRLLHARKPEIAEVLAWFDACTAAARIEIPMLVAAARIDPCVPPAGQFAIYEALRGPKRLFTQSHGHEAYPGEADEMRSLAAELCAFFAC